VKLAFAPIMVLDSKLGEFLDKTGKVKYLVATHLNDTPGTFRQVRNKFGDFANSVYIYPGDDVKF
jgi:hypothetical protein